MKVLLVLAACVAAACAASLSNEEVQKQFENFKLTHGKKYASEAEELYRSKIFKENAIRVHEHNARHAKGEVSFRVGLHKHADLHLHELVEARNGFRPEMKKPASTVHKAPLGPWPWSKTVDWRSKGLVTDVKDQGQCGSCWSFSATGALEGQLAKLKKKLPSLSEQNLVDCAWGNEYGSEGCNGGSMDGAFQYIADNQGIDSEESYPYTAVDGSCKYDPKNVAGTDSGYVDVHPTEKDLQHAVQTVGPISVAIDASQWSFNYYESGLYDEPACGNTQYSLDHGVLAVGFGDDAWWGSKGYWLVKNSWGSAWGENGFIRMSRNKDNQCGIALMASYPTV